MSNKNPFVFSTLIATVLLLNACGNKENTAQKAPSVQDYKVVTVEPKNSTLFSDYPATIEGQQNIEIRPNIEGYLSQIYVDEGATVHKGQVLFKIFAPQYEQEVRTANANILIAKADVNAASMEVNKVRPLVEKDIISKYELQSAQFTLEAKQAVLAQAQASLANANTNLSYTTISSPVNGIVNSIPYKIGSLVNGNTAMPLTTVSNTGNIYAYFSITEKQDLFFSENTKGSNMQARLATIPPVSLILSNGSEYPLKGRIETVVGSVNTQTGSISVRANFPNPQGLVRSGSSGIVRIYRDVQNALLIPQKATFEIQGKKFVYIVNEKGEVTSAEIDVTDSGDGQFYVVNKGLTKGDRVVIEGVGTLKEGTVIKPVEADSASLIAE